MWLEQRFRLWLALLGAGRRRLWSRRRESGLTCRLQAKGASDDGGAERRWDAVHEEGSPLVGCSASLGWLPFDPTRPWFAPGWKAQRVCGARPAPGGGTEFFQEIWAVPDAGPPAPAVAEPTAKPKLAPEVDLAAPTVRVSLRLEDPVPRDLVPRRPPGELAWAEGGRTSPVPERRRRALAEARHLRELHVGPLLAELVAEGAAIHAVTYAGGPTVSCTLPVACLSWLAARADVLRISPDTGQQPSEELSVPSPAGCSGPPARWDPTGDRDLCAPQTFSGVALDSEYLDSLNLAMGADAYLDRGYNGGNVHGGLAEWGQVSAWSSSRTGEHAVGTVPTLGLVSLDTATFWARHPAFLSFLGTDRVRAWVDQYGVPTADVSGIAAHGTGGHATWVTGSAAGNVTDGQDALVVRTEAREARSGLARGVAIVQSTSQYIRQTADVLLYGLLESLTGGEEEGAGGADVLTTSQAYSTTERPGCSGLDCQTEDELRGLDPDSLAVNELYHDGVLTFKSAGNYGGCETTMRLVCGRAVEYSHPSAAAACLAVGAADANTPNPSRYLGPPVELQTNEEMWTGSSGGTTLDGRIHPLLGAWSGGCGGPVPVQLETRSGGLGHLYWYADMGATSGAAPRAAGAAILFKHWALETQGSVANHAGWMAVNVLHFANGIAWSAPTATGTRVPTPAPQYGLGKLRMRLYEGSREGRTWGYQTLEWTASTGSIELADLGVLPSDVARIRVTAWWLEVNTDSREKKAHLALHLVSEEAGGFYGGVTTVETATDRVLRIDLDCTDPAFSAPTGGQTWLLLQGVDVPTEARDQGRAYRDVYVAIYWESGPDGSLLACGPDRECPTGAVTGPTAGGAPGLTPPSGVLRQPELLRSSLEAQILLLGGHHGAPMPGETQAGAGGKAG